MENEVIEWEPSGKVLPIFCGDYDANRVYENPDVVLYNNSSYVAKRTTVGNCPPAKEYFDDNWQMIAKGIIDANISESTIEFDEADERINIESGEESRTIMGKIRKFLSDLKPVAFSGKYSDLLGRITISNSAAVTQTGQMALDAVEKNAAVAGTLANQIAQQNSNLSTGWSDATVTESVSAGGIQWHRWGNMCEIVIAAEIIMPTAWTEIKIATGLPVSRFGSGARGIIQSQDTGLAYCILLTSNGDLFVRSDTHPQSGWYRGGLAYICFSI